MLSFSLLLYIHDIDEVLLIQDWMLDWAEMKSLVVHCQRFLCHQRTCDSHSCDMLWHQTGVVNSLNTGWIQNTGPIPEEHQREGVLVWTSNRQPQQTASYHLGMTRTKTVPLPRFQKCSQVVLIAIGIRMAWSRVSKAALRSKSASINTSFWFHCNLTVHSNQTLFI